MAKTCQYSLLSRTWIALTELYDDLSKIIRMPCPDEEPYITDFAFICRITPKLIFLDIGPGFHEET